MISVLLTCWNGKDDARHCLSSLAAQRFRDFETIFVDDGSEDGSADMVREQFPEVHLIARPEHRGFAAVNNLAASQAKGDLLFLVNTDTELPPDLLEILNDATERHPEFDVFSPQMINFFDRDTVDCKGMEFHKSLRARIIDQGRPVDPGEAPYEVFGATGGAMLLRREVYETLGLFDDVFYANNEDVDFVLRVRGAGFRTLYLPRAVVYHKRSVTEKRIPDKVLYLIQRNLVLAGYKNVPASLYLRYGHRHLLYNLYHLAKWSLKGKGRVVLKAKWDALKMARQVRRRPVSSRRLRSVLGNGKLGRKT